MQLIRSKIIPATQNAFWQALPEAWQSLNTRPCLVLSTPYSAGSAEEQTLLKMLAACKLDPGAYHILQVQPEQCIAWHQIKDQAKPQYVLLLGINPQQLGISALFRINDANVFDGCTFIPSLPLSQLIQMQDMRTALWVQGLKPLFIG